MSHGAISVFSGSIASGASTSGGIEVTRAWRSVAVEVGTMSTAAAIGVQASVSGSVWSNIFLQQAGTAAVFNAFVITNSVGTNGGITPIPAGFKHYRFLATAVVSGGVQLKLICGD